MTRCTLQLPTHEDLRELAKSKQARRIEREWARLKIAENRCFTTATCTTRRSLSDAVNVFEVVEGAFFQGQPPALGSVPNGIS
jgi:hypothetical protein